MRRLLIGIVPILVASGAHAAQPAAPEAGKEYVSVQIAAGDARGLAQLYERHAKLPYLRVEKRGSVYVLRAGFWSTAKEAKAALAGAALEQPLIRTAAFRPEAIVQSNWRDTAQASGAPAAAPAASSSPTPPVIQPATTQVAQTAPSRQSTGTIQPAPGGLILSRDVPAPQAAPAAVPQNAAPTSAAVDTPATRKAAASVMDEQEELRPFNQDDFALAFDIFTGAGDLRRAFKVAEKAVASVPDNMEWRIKLARVAEWTQRPQVAWAQREYMFRRGDRSNDTITALLRLAPIAPNFDTVIAVWQYKASVGKLTATQWNELAQLYDAATRPRDGSLYFEAQFRKSGDVTMLERAAQLSENAADDTRAYQLYSERLKLKPFSVDLALHAVVYLLRQDRTREAYALMQAHTDEVPADSIEFWQTFAQTAWELSELGGAEQGYRKYLGANKEATAADWSRLITLVRARNPGEAAQLAMEVYRRYKDMDYLILALTLRTDANDLQSQARIFASLSPEERAAAERRASFLVLRAQYFQRSNAEDRAWDDFSRALTIAGADVDVTVPALWFLIDSRRRNELQALLNNLRPQAHGNSAYWMPYAAAFHALDQYREAIYWYRKEITRQPDDSLLQLSYADALERYQQNGMADRVRKQVWLTLRERLPNAKPAAPMDADPDLLTLTRLALLNRPGDPALAVVREVAAQLRGLPSATGDDRETRTLILAWAVSTEQFHNARSWMWLRYAKGVAARTAIAQQRFDPRGADSRGTPPLWAEIQTALQLEDTQTMDRLLLTQGEALPIYNRYDTAYALGHWQQALNIAFRGIEKNNVDEDLYDRFRQHAPQYANYLQLQGTRDAFGDLNSRSIAIEARYRVFRKLLVKVGFSRALQSSADDDFNTLVPRSDRLSSIEGTWLSGPDNATSLALFRRSESTSQTGLRLTQTYRIDSRLSLDGVIEHRGPSTESTPMRVAGYVDSIRLGLNYNLGKREYVRIAPQIDRYYTQFNDYLGHSGQIELDFGYRIRTEYPDLRVRGFVTRQLMKQNGSVSAATVARLPQAAQDSIADGSVNAVNYFLPAGSTTTGLCLGGGENLAGVNLQEIYTRAWRPFFEACQQHNSINGSGYIGLIGFAGSVFGPDHLSVRLETSRGGTGVGSLARTLAVRYRYYF